MSYIDILLPYLGISSRESNEGSKIVYKYSIEK